MFGTVDMALNGTADQKRAWLQARSIRGKPAKARGGTAGQDTQGDKPFDGQLDGL